LDSEAAELQPPEPATSESISRAGIVALNFATCAVYADLYTTQPVLPMLSKEFGISPATAGLSISLVVLMIALVSWVYGFLSDILGRKPVMIASCTLLVVPTLLCAVVPSFRALLVLRALQGAIMPGVTAVAVAYLGDFYAGVDLVPKVGSWIAASVAGGLTGRVLGGLIAAWTHWRAPFIFFGIWTLAGAVVMARALPHRKPARPVQLSLAYQGMFGHFRNRKLVGAFLIGGGVFFSVIGSFTYLAYYLSGPPFGLSAAVISSLYLVYLTGVFTSLVAGRLAGGISARKQMGVGLVIACLGTLITLVSWLPAVLVGLVVLCVGMFIVQSMAPAFVNSNARGAKGAAGSLYTSFYYLGAALGSAVPGYALQVWGWKGVVASCITALGIGLLADVVLCR
jgi:YNFM family putative membrane transporter